MVSTTCHSRWCQRLYPEFQLSNGASNPKYCADVDGTFRSNSSYFYPNPGGVACCKLFCGQRSQLLQLECQDISETVAKLIWFMVVVLLLFAIIQVGCIFWGRGGRKVATIGGPLFLSFIGVVVYATHADKIMVSIDTPLYLVVGAMSVVAFSYYFSSFRYSISLTYELAAATSLIFTMFPIWMALTINLNIIFESEGEHPEKIREIARITLAALILSILWIIHSSLYRTIGYRATWTSVMEKGSAEIAHILPRLWILAGAAGHPTWRTTVGQSIGLYLTVLSWVISISSHNYLQRTCRDDLILFHIMLWIPPAILSMAILATQSTICIRVFLNLRGNEGMHLKWFQNEYQYLRALHAPYKQYYGAMISYRLGRDALEVESGIDNYKLVLCSGWIPSVDKFLAIMVFFLETIVFPILAFPGAFYLGICQWLVICFLKSTSTIVCFGWNQKLRPNLNEKIRAWQTLCEHCVSNETSKYYVDPTLDRKGLTNDSIDIEVCEILRKHRWKIRMPLLLDNIGPLGFTYLLQQLVSVMDKPGPKSANESSEERESALIQITDDPTTCRTESEVSGPDTFLSTSPYSSPELNVDNQEVELLQVHRGDNGDQPM